ncbi:related to Transaldolase B [Fusarium fujikuroi]|nr:related to Transaldolase B [Fusarium fujikuroi]SCN97922.1 related to Transaldolase B [Fusarium fujikuroi]SCO03735.1 related to Transaldolase B [Fusarium fujikuroi]SCO06735.1 related to Transaldolase B [Fusarium fujikuroi]SCO44926.1 related to Transaldolase B [Fusarium fujikuroi]
MAPPTENSFLQEIEKKTLTLRVVNVDVDTLNTEFIRSLPMMPNDQTCNPAWLSLALQDPSNAELIRTTALGLQDQGFLAILSRLAVHLCKRNIDLIKGRVLVQTSPSAAHNFQETLDHARIYVSEFEKAGIPKNRYCIKIMATGVFSVVQAVACSQASCLYISPYYNANSMPSEIRTHLDPSLWPDVQDPALEHPFSHRIAQMVQAYKTLFAATGKEQPLIKNAGVSFRSYKEVLASSELGCHSATISQDLLEELKTSTPGKITLPVSPKVASLECPYADDVPIPPPRLGELLTRHLGEQGGWFANDLTVDLLADGGKVLDQALEKDSEAARMVKEALDMFIFCEEETKKLIKGTALVASL